FFIGTENSTIIENAPESTADSIHTSILPTNTIQARESIKTSTMESGFYLITNVFSQHDLAMQWKEQLGTLGYHAETFINPKNNWEYIYIAHSKDILTHINLYESLRLRKEFENIWFLEIYQ